MMVCIRMSVIWLITANAWLAFVSSPDVKVNGCLRLLSPVIRSFKFLLFITRYLSLNLLFYSRSFRPVSITILAHTLDIAERLKPSWAGNETARRVKRFTAWAFTLTHG